KFLQRQLSESLKNLALGKSQLLQIVPSMVRQPAPMRIEITDGQPIGDEGVTQREPGKDLPNWRAPLNQPIPHHAGDNNSANRLADGCQLKDGVRGNWGAGVDIAYSVAALEQDAVAVDHRDGKPRHSRLGNQKSCLLIQSIDRLVNKTV